MPRKASTSAPDRRKTRFIIYESQTKWKKKLNQINYLMSGLHDLFSVEHLGGWSPSVDPVLLDVLLIFGRKTSSPVPLLRKLCRSLHEGANDGNQLLAFLGFSSSGVVASAQGMLTRTSPLSTTDVGTDVGRSCCHTGALQSSLSCLFNFMMKCCTCVCVCRSPFKSYRLMLLYQQGQQGILEK